MNFHNLIKGTRIFAVLLAVVLTFMTAQSIFAQSPDPQVAENTVSINAMWVLIAGALVFFMQAGFALVETGFTRYKNVAHTMMMNMMVFCIGALGYYFVGFGLQFGGVNYTYPAIGGLGEWAFSPTSLGDWSGLLTNELVIGGQHGIIGLGGFLLGGLTANFGVLVFFFFQMVFMDTAATIPTGSMAERFKFIGFVLMALWVSMFIYPLVAGWIWGGGWVANLGRTMGFGNGAVDFAGSGPVHLIGGSLALAGAIVIGPRIGKFNKDGSANAMPAHNIPMGILGTIILFFGWFGFNPGSSLAFTGAGQNLAILAAVNTLLAGAAGGVSAMAYVWLTGKKKPDPGMSVNGLLAGLVAITAPCAFVDTWAAVVIGIIAGVLVCLATVLLEKAKIDDPVGAIPVHFANGIFGVLAVGIFAMGNPDTAGWNGVATPVTGLLYGGTGQFIAQVIEAGSILIPVVGLSYVFFKILQRFNVLRSSRADELAGLDMPEMGVPGYVNIDPPHVESPRVIPQGAASPAE